jgi:predicted acylesterase/phospholipase RssA
MKKEKIILVLTGGGVKCSFQIGFLIELLKHDKFEIELIYGCSFGALLAPLVANKRLDILVCFFDIIKSIDQVAINWPWYYFPRLFKGIHNIFFNKGYYQDLKVTDILWNLLSEEEKINASQKCRIPAWNLINKKQDWFGGNSNIIDFYNGIKASIALWLFVKPYKYKDIIYTDGGSCFLHPVEPLIKDKVKHKKILFIDSCTRELKPLEQDPPDALSLMYHLHDININTIGKMQLTKLKEIYNKRVIIVKPDIDLLKNTLDFDKNRIFSNIELGKKKYIEMFKINKKTEIEYTNKYIRCLLKL